MSQHFKSKIFGCRIIIVLTLAYTSLTQAALAEDIALPLAPRPLQASTRTNGTIRERSASLLRELVAINSGTNNREGLDAMRRRLTPEFEALGLTATEHTVADGRKVLSFEVPGTQPSILLVGHIDTVFNTADAPAVMVETENSLKGPGVIDMKGGIVLMLDVLRDFYEAGQLDVLRSVRVVLNDDEETGSKASRATLRMLSTGCDAALIFEPGLPDGSVVTAHVGVRWLKMTIHGKAAHAGLEPNKGLNACVELGHKLTELGKLSDFQRNLTVNPGVIEGGSAPNVICETASVKLDVRFTRQVDLVAVLGQIEAISEHMHITNEHLALSPTAELTEIAAMQPMPSDSTLRLYELAQVVGQKLGQTIKGQAVGYASDGNNLAETGINLLVGLGPYGGGMHTSEEFMLAHSFAERAALSKAIIISLTRRDNTL